MSEHEKMEAGVKTKPKIGPWTIDDLQPAPLPEVEEPTFPWIRKPEEFLSSSVKTLLDVQDVLVTYDQPEDIKKLDLGCVYIETIECETAYDRLVDWLKEKFEELKEAGRETFHLYGFSKGVFRFHVARGVRQDNPFVNAADAMHELADAFRMVDFERNDILIGIDASDTFTFTTSGATASSTSFAIVSSSSDNISFGDHAHDNGTGR